MKSCERCFAANRSGVLKKTKKINPAATIKAGFFLGADKSITDTNPWLPQVDTLVCNYQSLWYNPYKNPNRGSV